MQLNIEQRRIINAKPTGHSLIKGVAGSGKTTVSVYRIPFLLNHYCFSPEDAILMLTFNRTLSNYIRYLYDKIDEESKIDFFSLIGEDKDKVQIETVDSLIYKYFCKYKSKHRLKLDISTDRKLRYQLIQQSIFELKKTFPDTYILEQKYSSFLLDEIDWIKSCNYMELEEYQNADRLGRMNKSNNDVGPQRLQKNSTTRKAIFELMLLFNNKLTERGLIDIKDAAALALKEAKQHVDKKYTHIIVDESQDLTRVQLEFISCLYQPKEYSSVMFVCDTAQSIYPHSWLVKGRSFTSIGYDMTGRSSSLSKNYRTTTQISRAAYSLIQNDTVILEDDNFVAPSLIDRQGSFPVYRAFDGAKQEADFVIKELKYHLIDQYDLKDIAVIAKNKSQLASIKEHLDKQGIPSTLFDSELNFDEEAVKLLTIHSIKGLEFKVVFIIGLNEGIIPFITYLEPEDQQVQITTDRKLLYVGMTRANELLYMTSSKRPSMFIREIDSALLKLSPRSLIRSCYPVSLDDYCFKDKIHNLFTKEEKVRQWFIKELQDTYKYPMKLIDVEYPVNSFSKTGAVDVAVCVYGRNKGTKVPFIFVEAKAYGTDLGPGINQLKSYMSNDKNCSYGVATNGREVVILNRDLEEIDDIPTFNAHMLPNSLESFTYLDIKHGRTCVIERDIKSRNEIEITEHFEKRYLTDKDTREFIVYGNIAAGLPIHMNSSVEDKFYLPIDWYNPHDKLFILKVRGDSMVGADIEDGDYVVIKRQEDAGNRDIVAVSLGDDATLKRLVKMGDTILLMPENEKYEPIQVRNGQARIVGVALGIIKRLCEDNCTAH